MKAQAKVRGAAEVQSMVELLVRANLITTESQNGSRSRLLSGPLTGPADYDGKNIFEKAFMPTGGSPAQSSSASDIDETPRLQDDADISRPSSGQPAPSLGSEASAPDVPEPQSPPPQQKPQGKPVLKRTFTDISLLNLQTQLSEAMSKPYKATDGATDYGLSNSDLLPSTPGISQLTHAQAPSLVHGHNNRFVPAAQAIFTTEAATPWTVLAANDLACLVFGVS